MVLWVQFPLEATLFFANFEPTLMSILHKNARNVRFVLFRKNSIILLYHPQRRCGCDKCHMWKLSIGRHPKFMNCNSGLYKLPSELIIMVRKFKIHQQNPQWILITVLVWVIHDTSNMMRKPNFGLPSDLSQ